MVNSTCCVVNTNFFQFWLLLLPPKLLCLIQGSCNPQPSGSYTYEHTLQEYHLCVVTREWCYGSSRLQADKDNEHRRQTYIHINDILNTSSLLLLVTDIGQLTWLHSNQNSDSDCIQYVSSLTNGAICRVYTEHWKWFSTTFHDLLCAFPGPLMSIFRHFPGLFNRVLKKLLKSRFSYTFTKCG